MSLFPKWQGTLTLPPLPERRVKVGGNWIVQKVFCGAETRAKIADSQFSGHNIITTELEAPFDEILLRQKGARRVDTPMSVLASPDIENLDEIPESFALLWDSPGALEAYADTPQKVLRAWTNKFRFRTEDEEAGLSGLRPPQVGALHAISAHFAVGREFDAATIVLPTGTGKTETMLATQVYRRLPLTLVIVPSDALRGQISNKFASLGILPDLYAKGADWDLIIKRLSEERIEQELRLQDIVLALKESGDLPAHLSLWNLRPKLSAQLFRTTSSEWTPLEYASVLPKGAESWHALSQTDNVLVAVVCRNCKVDWGDYQNVFDTIFDLVIIRWDKDRNALYLFAS